MTDAEKRCLAEYVIKMDERLATTSALLALSIELHTSQLENDRNRHKIEKIRELSIAAQAIPTVTESRKRKLLKDLNLL
jgi:hypothetical protein